MSVRIRLCADDYGISPAVDTAIRDLVVRGRLNATSVMVVSPSFCRAEATALDALNASAPRVAIGLHLTLTAPFRPTSPRFEPLTGGAFPPLAALLRHAVMHRLERDALRAEIASQLQTFRASFGRAPDFVDGHQHAQLFPQARDGFLRAVKQAAPGAWVRQGGRMQPLAQRLGAPKALVLDILSAQFRKRAARAGIPFNPAFAGAYDFSTAPDFGALMRQFLDGLPEDGLVMCHPGFVDETLVSLDPLTTQREAEHAFLAGEHFPPLLKANNVTLA